MAITNRERCGQRTGPAGHRPAPLCRTRTEIAPWRQLANVLCRIAAHAAPKAKPANLDDPQILLGVLWDQWNAVFRNILGHAERSHRQRIARRSQPLGAQRAVQQQRRHPGARFDGAAAQRRLRRRSGDGSRPDAHGPDADHVRRTAPAGDAQESRSSRPKASRTAA